ncbi:MAG: RluA family pseudouridine synthase [Thermoleophilaceae bacterium]|nr:RluA family pseudouridine synthase [Thermoleophilaceae bacterium]
MTPPSKIELIVSAESAGERLDRVIAVVPEVGSRAQAAKLIAQGQVALDGETARKSERVEAGDLIEIELVALPAGDPSEPAVPFEIVYEDASLLVVDKPSGLVVHPAPGNRTGTLSQALVGLAGGGDPERPGIVHRLDKETSGLLVVARNDDVLRKLQAALQARKITRKYTALVRGQAESAKGTIDAPLGRDRRKPENIAVRMDSDRTAVTHFEVVEEIGPRSLLHVSLETGRTHQIRVHLAAIGLPVCGDPQYGIDGDLGLTRQFLHASELSFDHPVTGEHLSLGSPLPPDLAQALERARADG